MSDPTQQQLALIPHAYEGEVISQRSSDGYINATAMCRAVSKEWSKYRELKSTREFFPALALDLGLTEVQLALTIQGTPGGDARNQGTWVHPRVAIHLAQWLSPEFAVKVTGWVHDWLTGLDPRDRVWKQFEDRVSLVYDNVPVGYFCIFHESASMFATLIIGGANFGTKMILDISVGWHWGKHWKDEGLERRFGPRAKFDHNFPHYFPQSWSNPQQANCYPDAALPEFRRWLRDVYMPVHLPRYLQDQVRQKKLPADIATSTMDALTHRERIRALPRPA